MIDPDILKNSLTQGYADAFRSLFEEEKKKSEAAEAKLQNTLAWLKVVEDQLYRIIHERDALKIELDRIQAIKVEELFPEINKE